MSKAEERALEKYPKEMYEEVGWRCVDKNANKRQYFIEGYHQSEKDLELTWEDMRLIDTISSKLLVSIGNTDDKKFYEEVLKRFKDLKK